MIIYKLENDYHIFSLNFFENKIEYVSMKLNSLFEMKYFIKIVALFFRLFFHLVILSLFSKNN